MAPHVSRALYTNLRARLVPMLSKCISGREVVGIVGRTRKGKSRFACALADELGAVVVDCTKDWPIGVSDGSALASGIVFFDHGSSQADVERVAEFARTHPATRCVVIAETADLLGRFATALNPSPDAFVQVLEVESLQAVRTPVFHLRDMTTSFDGTSLKELQLDEGSALMTPPSVRSRKRNP